MSQDHLDTPAPGRLDRRDWLRVSMSAAGAGLLGLASAAKAAAEPAEVKREAPKTRFQIACMTLPYARFPLERALTGIQKAGYRYIAWGTAHLEGSERVPVVAPDAPPPARRSSPGVAATWDSSRS